MNEEHVIYLADLLNIARNSWFNIEYNSGPGRSDPSELEDLCADGGYLLWLLSCAYPDLVKSSCHTSKLAGLSQKARDNNEGDQREQQIELWIEAINSLEEGDFDDLRGLLADWERLWNDDASSSEERVKWIKCTWPLRERFRDRSARLLHALYSLLRVELLNVPVVESSRARLTVLISDVYQFRWTFLLFCAKAIGWYLPDKESHLTLAAEAVGVDLGSAPASIQVKPAWPFYVDCIFYKYNVDGNPIRFGWDWFGYRSHEGELFSMWTYDRGQSCNYTEDIPGPSQVACWIVDRTGAYLMEEQAQRIEHNLEPLLDANSVREPLREAVNAIRDGSPMWLPRRVDWAYYKRISETIHTLESIVPSTEKPASLGRTVAADVEFVDIPPDNRTRPMSKTELAEIWGEEVNQKDINQMIDAGALLVIPLSRQKFIFDKAKLPTGVLEKLKQIG